MKKFLIIFVLIATFGFPLVSAHPFTEDTNPTQFSNVLTGTTEVTVYYSEGVEIDFSALKVFDSNGDQVDNKDTRYFEGDYSLAVTTPPLTDGTYTVTSKVLSKVDGHLVDDAFVFAVGDVKIDPALLEKTGPSELIFFPEAGARFPGFVGETIVLGVVISSLLIWGTQRTDIIKDQMTKLQKIYHGKFVSLIGIGLILVFASNVLVLAMQTIRLETSAFDALQTSFGTTWIVRMIITIVLLGIWFAIEKIQSISKKTLMPLLIFSLVLIGTSTMIGHGAASEQSAPIILDYAHNLIASVWIGGIIFYGFILLPTFSNLDEWKKEHLTLLSLPKFSIMFIISLGVLIITGPTLMWFLESNVGMIVESGYGKLIIMKIIIASIMVVFGGYNMFRLQKKGEENIKKSSIKVHKKLRNSLKIEAGLGILLLGVVALLTNGTLPAGEVQTVEAQEITYGLSTVEFSEQAMFDVQLRPFTSGLNNLKVTATDFSGNPLSDMDGVKVKVSNPSRNISPIEIPMNPIDQVEGEIATKFQGDVTFGFSGDWQMQIEAQRTQNANEEVLLNLLIKPRLPDIKTEIIEYDFPEQSSPLYPIYDGKGNIWISDASAPRIWKFTIADKTFSKYEFDGQASITLEIDNDGKVWFTDIPESRIGYIDPKTEQVGIVGLDDVFPKIDRSIPLTIETDYENNIWVSIASKNSIVKYNQDTEEFEQFVLPTKDSIPFAVVQGPDGKIWFTQQGGGQIGYINPETGEIREIIPPEPLNTPETMIFDKDGNIWIAEHNEG
ncbi:MAG: CopD family protein, partial [Nitrosopumilaceae archaeon]